MSNIEDLLRRLSLSEKISLLAGADTWQTQEIAHLGIGSLKTTDGPSGARGQCSVDGPTAAFMPGPVCQAATWSRKALRGVGELLSREAKTKGAQILLAPTICCARNPLGGRNFECFGEDPFLSGALAVEYVAGIQASGDVVATPKHFVANEQETDRYTINANISEKALREIYLKPFEMVVRSENPPGCLMTSYNIVNGSHMDMSDLLQTVLRDEWNFQGLVMSDWGGTNAVADSLVAGCDLEMPGPPEKRGAELVAALAADKSGQLEKAVDVSVRRLLSLAKKRGLLGLTEAEAAASRHRAEFSDTSKQDIRFMRNVAASGIVLLKNKHNALPLRASLLQSQQVAFIGPNAKIGTPGGGGSAMMNPQYFSQPMDSFRTVAAANGIDVTVKHSLGAAGNKWLPLFSEDQWAARKKPQGAEEKSMIRVDFFATADLSGPVVETQFRDDSQIDLLDTAPMSLRQEPIPPYSHRATSTVTPAKTGLHQFSLSSVGESRLIVDGEVLLDNRGWKEYGETFYSFGSVETRASKYLMAGQSYDIVTESFTKPCLPGDREHVFGWAPSVRLGYQEQLPDDMIAQAVQLANDSAFSVVVLGLDNEWESEGFDRNDMHLPGSQDELVLALLRGCERPESLIFVNQSGSPVEFPWVARAGTLLQAWYGGQEAGFALADILLGTINPSGRLPITWPRKYSDLPFAADEEMWPGVDGIVQYKEGGQVGYRYYMQTGVQPEFWFGYGLSYTEFGSMLGEVAETNHFWTFRVFVTNQGPSAGEEVVQLYAWPAKCSIQKTLAAFDKTTELAEKETTSVILHVKKRDLAVWEDKKWVLTKGEYVFGLGQHVGDAEAKTVKIRVAETRTWLAAEY